MMEIDKFNQLQFQQNTIDWVTSLIEEFPVILTLSELKRQQF